MFPSWISTFGTCSRSNHSNSNLFIKKRQMNLSKTVLNALLLSFWYTFWFPTKTCISSSSSTSAMLVHYDYDIWSSVLLPMTVLWARGTITVLLSLLSDIFIHVLSIFKRLKWLFSRGLYLHFFFLVSIYSVVSWRKRQLFSMHGFCFITVPIIAASDFGGFGPDDPQTGFEFGAVTVHRVIKFLTSFDFFLDTHLYFWTYHRHRVCVIFYNIRISKWKHTAQWLALFSTSIVV